MGNKLTRVFGIVTLILGIIFIATGATAWAVVTSQLKDEQITVSDDAPFAKGKQVAGPISAYAQAEVIKIHALDRTEGETYATLGDLAREAEAAGDDAAAAQYQELRTFIQKASFLRSSLFTSVLSYGVALFAMGVGAWMVFAGIVFSRKEKVTETVVRDRRDDRVDV